MNDGRSATSFVRRVHDRDPAALRHLLFSGEQEKRAEHRTILPLALLHPVTQVRQTFNKRRIITLAESIAKSQLMNPIMINAVDEDGAQRYLDLLALIWQAHHTLDEIPTTEIDGTLYYLIFTAGERRTRAMHWLTEHPCVRCEASGSVRCLHLDPEKIPVKIYFGATPMQIFEDQIAENNHERPESHAEAFSFRAGFELARLRNEVLTPHAYAKSIGHDPSAVYRALAYTDLPDYVQNAVAEGKTNYTKALALHRYHEQRKSEQELKAWLDFCIARPSMNTATLQKHLVMDLAQWANGQTSLFAPAVRRKLEKKARRAALDGQMSRDLNRIREFVAHVVRARASGEIGRRDSPFSDKAAGRNIVEIMKLLEEYYLPQFVADQPKRERQRILKTWERLKKTPRCRRMMTSLNAN